MGARRARRARRSRTTRSPSPTRPARTPTCASARARARRSSSCAPRRCGPRSTGAASSSPTTSPRCSIPVFVAPAHPHPLGGRRACAQRPPTPSPRSWSASPRACAFRSPPDSEHSDETPLAADRPWHGRAHPGHRVLRRRQRGRQSSSSCTSASCCSPCSAASVASLYLARRSDIVTRSLSPDVATVGRDALVTVRVGVRTAVPDRAGHLARHGAEGARRRRRRASSPPSARDCAERSAIVELSYAVTRRSGAASIRSVRFR